MNWVPGGLGDCRDSGVRTPPSPEPIPHIGMADGVLINIAAVGYRSQETIETDVYDDDLRARAVHLLAAKPDCLELYKFRFIELALSRGYCEVPTKVRVAAINVLARGAGADPDVREMIRKLAKSPDRIRTELRNAEIDLAVYQEPDWDNYYREHPHFSYHDIAPIVLIEWRRAGISEHDLHRACVLQLAALRGLGAMRDAARRDEQTLSVLRQVMEEGRAPLERRTARDVLALLGR